MINIYVLQLAVHLKKVLSLAYSGIISQVVKGLFFNENP